MNDIVKKDPTSIDNFAGWEDGVEGDDRPESAGRLHRPRGSEVARRSPSRDHRPSATPKIPRCRGDEREGAEEGMGRRSRR